MRHRRFAGLFEMVYLFVAIDKLRPCAAPGLLAYEHLISKNVVPARKEDQQSFIDERKSFAVASSPVPAVKRPLTSVGESEDEAPADGSDTEMTFSHPKELRA